MNKVCVNYIYEDDIIIIKGEYRGMLCIVDPKRNCEELRPNIALRFSGYIVSNFLTLLYQEYIK